MSKENKDTSAEQAEKSGIRMAQVAAAARAAFTLGCRVLPGSEGPTGTPSGGANGTTIGGYVAGGSGSRGKKTQQPPTTQTSTPSATTQAPTSSPTPTATSTPNTTSPTSPT